MADTRARGGAPAPFERVAIIGCGLIGGSLGLAIKARWPSALVIAVDRKDVIEAAMRRGAADVGADDLVLAAEAQLIVLAAPVRANIGILSQLAAHVPGEALVTDVGSTKRDTVSAAQGLPGRLTFIGGHPLAGAALGGFDAARPELFSRRPWILTAGDGASAADASRLESMLEGVGAVVHRMTPDEHDRLAAYISHLPQFVVSALMHVVGSRAGEAGLGLAGRGLRDTTRLATSPAAVWQDILATNADHIGAAIDELVDVLTRMKTASAEGRALNDTFDSAAQWKRALERHFEDS